MASQGTMFLGAVCVCVCVVLGFELGAFALSHSFYVIFFFFF
jgi:hypothetical protein